MTTSRFYANGMEEELSGGGELDSEIALHFASFFYHTVSVCPRHEGNAIVRE